MGKNQCRLEGCGQSQQWNVTLQDEEKKKFRPLKGVWRPDKAFFPRAGYGPPKREIK